MLQQYETLPGALRVDLAGALACLGGRSLGSLVALVVAELLLREDCPGRALEMAVRGVDTVAAARPLDWVREARVDTSPLLGVSLLEPELEPDAAEVTKFREVHKMSE